jgi:hypothetical protein
MANSVTPFRWSVVALSAVLVSCASADGSGDDLETLPLPLGTFNVLTRNYDNQRTGANLSERTLLPSNVSPSTFGRVFQLSVDDQIYAQLLYASAVSIGGATRNVVYAATVNNSVYAFDADAGGGPLWTRNFNGAGRPPNHTEVGQACGSYNDFSGNMGIVGTPVIDPNSQVMYFVSRTVEAGAHVHRLRAIDVGTGNERAGSPKVLQFSSAGSGAGSSGGRIAFDPKIHNQRAALALSGGVVYVAWASHCDTGPYHGWVAGFDAGTLAQTGVFNSTPTGALGGIWQAGGGPAIDASGNLYYATGNGDFDGTNTFGESLVKLTPRTLGLVDFFAPWNFSALNSQDLDFGSSGPSLVPGTAFVFMAGKEGRAYVTNAGNLGREASGDMQIQQTFQANDPALRPNDSHHIHSSTVYWNAPQGLTAYTWGENDVLRAWRFNRGSQRFDTPAVAVGSVVPPIGMPGGFMTLSANGSAAGTGIVWTATPLSGNANQMVVPGVVHAFHAETLALLWNSNNGADAPGNLSKYNPPLVAAGRVYVATFSNSISVYGLRTGAPPPSITNGQVSGLRRRNSNVCIDVPGSNEAANARVGIFTCNGTGAQAWQLNDEGAGQWELRRNGTGLCLDIPGGSAQQGQAVQQFPCNGSLAQRFQLDPVVGGIQVRAAGSQVCVDVPQSSTTPGTLLQLWGCNGSDAQVFAPFAPQIRKLDSGIPGVCTDSSGSSLMAGLRLQTWGCNGSGAQNWQIDDNHDGSRSVRRNSTGLCMEAPGTPAQGSAVTQNACNRSAAQTWLAEAAGTGQQLRLQGTSFCIDVLGSSNDNGTQLGLWTCNQSGAQIFGL